MEKMHGVVHSQDGLGRVISLHVLPPPGSRTRLVADWLGLWSGSPSWAEEDLPTGNLPFPLDDNYEDSIAHETGFHSFLDLKFERSDSDFTDSDPATVSWDPILDDSESIGRWQPEQGLPEDQDLELEHDEFVEAFFDNLSHTRLAKETLRFVAFGVAVHLAALSLFVASPTPSLIGYEGISDKPISVKLKETCEITTPDAPSPGSVDSPAALASLARTHPKHEEKNEREHKKNETAETGAKHALLEEQTHFLPVEPKPASKTEPAHQSVVRDHPLKHGPFNDSKDLQDSLASTPSVASPERRDAPKAGDEAQSYKDKILSAIHDAAYYPGAALRKMASGRAVVAFTINKDGSLANISIVAHAGSEVLDEAAVKIVEKASSHFPPIPESLMKEQVSYVVPIIFKKKG